MNAILGIVALGVLLLLPGSAGAATGAAETTVPAMQAPTTQATVAAPPEMSPASSATPGALSAPAVSTTPPAATAPAAPPTQAASIGPLPAPLEAAPPPDVQVEISLARQRMVVRVAGVERHSWAVSTARKGYRTPLGTYRPERMHKRYFSRKYDNAPMPYAIFFHKGWAIHGTDAVSRLGRPASHGCVRLHPNNARALFALVSEYGRANTRIVVTR
ncbi:L,D-transpeptidase [Ancylobacter sp. IITR112]|uniref:L,D-transpeptidase n=1 Tax=Ancylobacter sp. IITR112 TaxID=3138073 RepID=UPI00352A66C2